MKNISLTVWLWLAVCIVGSFVGGLLVMDNISAERRWQRMQAEEREGDRLYVQGFLCLSRGGSYEKCEAICARNRRCEEGMRYDRRQKMLNEAQGFAR